MRVVALHVLRMMNIQVVREMMYGMIYVGVKRTIIRLGIRTRRTKIVFEQKQICKWLFLKVNFRFGRYSSHLLLSRLNLLSINNADLEKVSTEAC